MDAAKILRGKHKAIFTPHVDTGDFVIIINAEKRSRLPAQQRHRNGLHHTGCGALKSIQRQQELDKRPKRRSGGVVRGMVPHNKLAMPSAKAQSLQRRRASPFGAAAHHLHRWRPG